jgi:serine/threonine protein kinase/tetratricopeptide (TPR) repeat protein
MADRDLSQIESVFHAALDLPVAERDAYLKQACDGDEALLAEVSSLLSMAENGNGFLEQPALVAGFEVLVNTSQQSLLGKSIGSYQITAPLGKGGMGEVYLAEDTKLDRKVALKFLSPEFVGDNWAKRQLVKEAQAAARLDHPNICSVYGIENSDGYDFIVMQFVEGETLADLIGKKSIEPDRVTDLTRQIVSALAEAHAHGIIHRDIKPKNIMVTEHGHAKVLDFGLAKTIQTKKEHATVEESVSQLSQNGVLAGTVSYMSPEQLRGDRLDYRTDVFSMGTVLYEMVTGENPYARESTAETISSILTFQPPPLGNSVPNALRLLDPIVSKCAQKDLDQRYPAASALLYDLDNLGSSPVKRRSWLSKTAYARLFIVVVSLLFAATIGAFIYARVFRTYSLAVLPIVNQSGSPNDYISSGLTAAIADKLSGVSHLRVKPATSVAGYKADEVDLQKVGASLGVDALVVGRIVEEQGELTLELTLVDSNTGIKRQISKDKLTIYSAYAIPEEAARRVANHMEVWLRTKDKEHLAEGTSNSEAFRNYMLGTYYWRNRNKDNIKKAVDSFYEATRLDPLYAEAYAGLAECYVLSNRTAFGNMTTEEAMNRAKAAANEALRLNEQLPQAHSALAMVYLNYEWKWAEAEKEIKRALELDPEYAPAHYAYSILLTIRGQQKEAIEQSKIAKDNDPLSKSSKMNYCRSFYYARDFDTSVSCFQGILKEDPDSSLAWYVFGYVALQEGHGNDAIGIFEKLYQKDPVMGASALGYAYGKMNRTEEALKILAFAQEHRKQNPQFPAQELAIIYLGLGDKSNALTWFEKACDERFGPLIYLDVEPIFAELHSEPRFVALSQRMNLASANRN